MKRRGSFLVYGEYLMHQGTSGLISCAEPFLATQEHTSSPLHDTYDQKQDSVAAFVRNAGHTPQGQFRGNLPLGHGLGGSTILAFLHLWGQVANEELHQLILASDEISHGFPSSGVDYNACFRQNSGLYASGIWQDVRVLGQKYVLAFLERERERTLSTVRKDILANDWELRRLAEQLSIHVRTRQVLVQHLLFRYCEVLCRLGVYARNAQKLAENMLSQGIPAKCVGGLYDKAVLIIPPSELGIDQILEIVAGCDGLLSVSHGDLCTSQ